MLAKLAQRQLQLYIQEQDGPDALLFGEGICCEEMLEFEVGELWLMASTAPA